MPIALAQLGLKTLVADPDSQQQTGKNSGGEWDWTDYSRWGVETRCAGMQEKLFEDGELGVAVSVSVIEHIPATVRREGLKAMATALEQGGLMVLTVDLVKGSRQLWNRVLDIEVEPLEIHGSAEDLIAEAAEVNLKLLHRQKLRLMNSLLKWLIKRRSLRKPLFCQSLQFQWIQLRKMFRTNLRKRMMTAINSMSV